MARSRPPYVSPMNLYEMYSGAGRATGGAFQSIGKGMQNIATSQEEYNKLVGGADFVNRLMGDAKNSFNLTDRELQRLPKDITKEEAQEIVTAFKIMKDANSNFRSRFQKHIADGEFAPPDVMQYFGGKMSDAKSFVALLDQKGKELEGVAQEAGLKAIGPQKRETARAQAFGEAAGIPGLEPGFRGKTAIKEGLSPQEELAGVRAGQNRQFRITKEMETRKNRALQNYEHLLATNPKQAQQELQTYYAYDRMLKEGILPPDETKIASWAEKYMKQSDKQDQKGLDAQMLQAQAMKDPMVKRFGQSAMRSSIEKLLPGSPFKTIDDFYQALGQPNPFAETPAEPEAEGPGIGERVKKGAELWKRGLGTIFGGGKEQPKQGAGRFKVKVKK